MGKKKVAGGKTSKRSASAAADTASSAPARTRNADHLKNQKLHGLEFGLTQRNNILIDCYAADRVPRDVILECFEKAGIYPPGASAALVPKVEAIRSSRRIVKVDAAKDIQRIANNLELSVDERIIQISQVVEDVMELAKFEQVPVESLCPKRRGRKGKKKVSSGELGDANANSPSPESPSHVRPAYGEVVGNFSPGKLLQVSASFAKERDDWNKSRLFVCTFKGCTCGLRGAPSRFSGEGYLRSHMRNKHSVTLAPMAADVVNDLKRQQQAAAADSPATSVDTVRGFVASQHAGLPDLCECIKPLDVNVDGTACDDGSVCGFQTSSETEMDQHYWSQHTNCLCFGGFCVRNLVTGEETMEELGYEAPALQISILKQWLGPNLFEFSMELQNACWRQIMQDADDNDDEADYERVASALAAAGHHRPVQEPAAIDLVEEEVAPATPPKKKKVRKCSLCNQPGHDKRVCKQQQQQQHEQQQQRSSPRLSPIRSAQHTPARTPESPNYSATPSPASPETAAATPSAAPRQKTCSVQ